jgi:glycerol-3-phosphate O-acyltransferase
MKFQFPGHSILVYVGTFATLLVTLLVSYAIYINGFVQPWVILGGMNLLGYIMLIYIYLTE